MTTESPTASRDSLLAQVLDGYLSACRRGERPDSGVLVAKHPEIASELRTCLASLEFIQNAEQSSGMADLDGEIADQASGGNGSSAAGPTLGDFRILRQIGRGGMGVVYEAEQISLRRRVALKTLPFAGVLDKRQLARFKNEALSAAALQHPNIVPVYAVGCERGVHYYAMQYITGRNLAELITEQRIREGLAEPEEVAPTESVHQPEASARECKEPGDKGQETEDRKRDATAVSRSAVRKGSSTHPTKKERQAYYCEIARIGQEVAEALAHAHAEGVIHRDIKPSNLLLDEDGKIWITDFGLAQTRSDGGLTMTGDLVGTLRYMSPEQALGKRVPIDHRTDVYSLGVTLYELLTLEPMLQGTDREELLRQIAFDDPIAPRKLRPDLPLDLGTILLKAVAKDPRERYDTAQSLADDLSRYLNNTPILARRPSIGQRASRWCRRHSTLAVSATVILLCALIFTAVSSSWIARDRFQQQQDKLAAVSSALADAREAALREEKAKQEATSRLAQVENGADVLTALFADMDVRFTNTQSRRLEVRLSEHLLTMARQLETKPIADPTSAAKVQLALGWSLVGLGKLKEGTVLLEQSLATRHTLLGLENADTIDSMNCLATALGRQGHFQKAIPLFETALSTTLVTDAPTLPRSRALKNNLANCYLYAGEYEKAVRMFDDVLVSFNDQDVDNLDRLKAMDALAVTYLESGHTLKALSLLEETVPRVHAILGHDQYLSLLFTTHLARCYRVAGRSDKAESLFRELSAIATRSLGSNHPLAIEISKDLGGSKSIDPANGVSVLEESFRLAQETFGEGHLATTAIATNLIIAYQRAGYPDKSITLAVSQYPKTRAALGEDHPATLMAMQNYAFALLSMGHADEALPVALKALRLSERKLGEAHSNTMDRMDLVAKLFWATGQRDNAIGMWKNVVARSEFATEEQYPNLSEYSNNLGQALCNAGFIDEARAYWEKVLEDRKNRFGIEHFQARIAMDWLAQCHIRIGATNRVVGEQSRAIALREELLRIQRLTMGPTHPNTLAAMSNLANTYRDSGLPEKAIPLLEAWITTQESNPAVERYAMLGNVYILGMLYADGKQSDRAVLMFDKFIEKSGTAQIRGEQPIVQTMAEFAERLLACGRPREAEAYAKRGLDLCGTSATLASCRLQSVLGDALVEQSKFEDAEPLLLDGYRGIKGREGAIPPSNGSIVTMSIDRLVRFYAATNHPEEERRWQAERAEYDK